jgi:glycosyltransferase involved in cell wall biosynthesis
VKILLVHNYYQRAGGEDVVVEREQALLNARGHDARLHSVSNAAVRSAWDAIRTACRTPYSGVARRRMAAAIERLRPEIVHVHNFFPLLTPSIFDACREARVPVVQTVHNYRHVCLNASLFRNGRVCEACLGKSVPWPGVIYGCYRGSRAASGAVAAMLTLHRLRRTWLDKVDMYISPTEFVRQKLVQGGFPAHKIVVKPHFVDPDPGPGAGRGGYALFVGRVSPEKGLPTALAAWSRLGGTVRLKVVGDVPAAFRADVSSRGAAGVDWLGARPHSQVQALMRDALVLVFPSACYETFGLVVAEAFAAGLPVIASDIGTMSAMISNGQTGLHFRPNDPEDLAAKVSWLCAHPEARAVMAQAARAEFERKYTADHSYRTLVDVYGQAKESAACAA